MLSPITYRCLLRVLCPVSRPITALVCVLLKDSSRAPWPDQGQRSTPEPASVHYRDSSQCQMLIPHPSFHLLSYILPRDRKAGLRPNKPLTRSAPCKPVSICNTILLLLLVLALQPTLGFSLLSDSLPFRRFLTPLSPLSYSHLLYIFFNVLNPSFPWSSSDYAYRFPL